VARLKTVRELLEKKDRLVTQIKSTLDSKGNSMLEKTTNFSVEDGVLKVRLEGLKKAQFEM